MLVFVVYDGVDGSMFVSSVKDC